MDTRFGMTAFERSLLYYYNKGYNDGVNNVDNIAGSILKYMKFESEYFETFYNSMAISGESGTLKYMFKGSIAESKLRAKSGTINRVKGYSGYVTSKSGREIAFSMVVNNFSCTSREARAKLEQLMIALAEFNK